MLRTNGFVISILTKFSDISTALLFISAHFFKLEVYDLKCSACHKTHEKFIGPPPVGIFDRRSPEWIMNMILNPEEMIAKDPIAVKLLAEYNFAPMANQNITEDEARAILEYFRTL